MTGVSYSGDTRSDELDAWSLARAIWQRRTIVLITTIIIVGATAAILATITPRFSSQAKILIENRQAAFGTGESAQDQSVDEAAVLSQVEILSSRDLAARVVDTVSLGQYDEFNQPLRNASLIHRALISLGLVSDESAGVAAERVTDAYLRRLSVYQIGTSRVIGVEFSSRDAELAAAVANTLADEYLALQRVAKSDTNQEAVAWLAREIDQLRSKVAEAEDAVAQYRSESGIFEGTRDRSLSQQQLSELNAELIRASAAKSEAQAKADLINRLLKEPGGIEEAVEVLNSPLIQRLREQQAAVSREHAELSATLLPGHPRMRQLTAELGDLEDRIASEARKIARGLENEAEVAGAREAALSRSLVVMKEDAGQTSKSEVKLRALEREAAAQRETLESLLRRYREASARQDVDTQPANARIISRARVATSPSYPPRGPIFALASIAGVLLGLAAAFIAEMFGRDSRPARPVSPRAAGRASPASGEPTLAPDLAEPAIDGEETAPGPVVADSGGAVQIGRRLAQLAEKRGVKRFAFLSLGEPQSVAAVAMQVARAVAAQGVAPVIVDAIQGAEDVDEGARGLFSVLAGEAAIGEVMIAASEDSAAMIPAGGSRPDAEELVASGRIRLILDALMHRFDIALILAGDLDGGPAPLAIANAADLALILVAPDQLSGADLKNAIKRLQEAGAGQAAILSDGANGLTFYDAVSVRGPMSDAA